MSGVNEGNFFLAKRRWHEGLYLGTKGTIHLRGLPIAIPYSVVSRAGNDQIGYITEIARSGASVDDARADADFDGESMIASPSFVVVDLFHLIYGDEYDPPADARLFTVIYERNVLKRYVVEGNQEQMVCEPVPISQREYDLVPFGDGSLRVRVGIGHNLGAVEQLEAHLTQYREMKDSTPDAKEDRAHVAFRWGKL
jgi:hypothetical protein